MDYWDHTCDDYSNNPQLCGKYDAYHFTSTRMCCVCRKLVSGKIPEILYYIRLYLWFRKSFRNFFIYLLPLGLPRSPFQGFCSDPSVHTDILKQLDSTTPQNCYSRCIHTQGCTAFAFLFNSLDKCTLYKGGPYKTGFDGFMSGKKCYVMEGKHEI